MRFGEKEGGSPMDGDRGQKQERTFYRRRGCRFCSDRTIAIDHKDRALLQSLITERCKIIPQRISGCCAKHQREVTVAIKRARHLAVLPYTTAQW